VFLAPNAPPLRGRETVRQLYTSLFARFHVTQKFLFEEIQSMGDWAFAWGTDDITMTPIAGGPPAHYVGHGVSILRRDPDHVWRFARGINNASLL
jgi:ketosteroid isomerase-like protein